MCKPVSSSFFQPTIECRFELLALLAYRYHKQAVVGAEEIIVDTLCANLIAPTMAERVLKLKRSIIFIIEDLPHLYLS